jgi:hypothetical protein
MAPMRDIQYHVIVLDQDTNGGPRQELFELTPECLNLVWQRSLNLAGNAAFTLMRNSRKLQKIDFGRHHLRVIRQDKKGDEIVFAGKIMRPDWGGRDCVVLAWDYLALFAKTRVDYYLNINKKKWANKTIGNVMTDLFDNAIGINRSPVGFVAKGATQDPLNVGGTGPVKTNKSFAVANLQPTLTVLFDLAEMAMTNTGNTVVFEVTDALPHTYNIWKDRGVKRTNYAFTYPGNLSDWGFVEDLGAVVNDFATLVRNSKKPTGKSQLTIVSDDANPSGIPALRRLQGSAEIGTLVGFSSGTPDKDQQHQAAQRLARRARRIPQYLTLYPRQGYLSPFEGWDLGDTFQTNIQKTQDEITSDQINGDYRVHSVAAAWSAEAGESMQLFCRQRDLL